MFSLVAFVMMFGTLVGLLSDVAFIPAVFMLVHGIIMLGLLLLPRFHLIDKIFSAFGNAAMGLGAGGVALVIFLAAFKIIVRVAAKSQRADGPDLSALTASAIGPLLGSLALFAAFASFYVFLWKRFGFVRVAAAGYLMVWLPFMVLTAAVGGYQNPKSDFSFPQSRFAQPRSPQSSIGPNSNASYAEPEQTSLPPTNPFDTSSQLYQPDMHFYQTPSATDQPRSFQDAMQEHQRAHEEFIRESEKRSREFFERAGLSDPSAR